MNNQNLNETILDEFPTKSILNAMYNEYDEHDPRSQLYQRVHIVPEINWIVLTIKFVIPLIMISLVFKFTLYLLSRTNIEHSYQIAWIICSSVFLIYVLFNMRKILIGLIKLYQRFASHKIRDKCRFEPSCSQYMIDALSKYGTIRGLHLGMKRLRKCNIHGGGFDYL